MYLRVVLDRFLDEETRGTRIGDFNACRLERLLFSLDTRREARLLNFDGNQVSDYNTLTTRTYHY